MVENKKGYFLHQSLSTYNVWFLFGPLIPPHGNINATASCGLLALCAFLPSGLFLMPLLPQTPLGSHIVAFALGFVCASVCLGSLVPSLYLAAQCLPRTVRIGQPWLCLGSVCAGLCPALVSRLTHPPLCPDHSLSPPFSPASSNISTGRDVFFRRPDMLGEKAWTLGLST